MGHVADAITALTKSFHSLVGARCLSLAGHAVVLIEVFFSSDYLSHEPFSLLHYSELI